MAEPDSKGYAPRPRVDDLCLGDTATTKTVHHADCRHARQPYNFARAFPDAGTFAVELVATGAWRWHHFCQACCGDVDDVVRAAVRDAEEAIGGRINPAVRVGSAAWWQREFETMHDLKSKSDELIERLISSGEVWCGGERVEVVYDPMTSSQEGLDDCCFFCGAWRLGAKPQLHHRGCAWIAAMAMRGHAHPDHVEEVEGA